MPVYTEVTHLLQNSYVSYAEALAFIGSRLYTTSWDDAQALPDGYDYRVDDPGSALVIGATTIPVKDGTGSLADGSISFVLPESGTVYEKYTVTAHGASSITISPGLVTVPDDSVPIYRLTINDREKAILWATQILDAQIDWFGSPRYAMRDSAAPQTGPFQNLRWPRMGVIRSDGYAYPYDRIPEDLKRVTAELAIYLLQRDLSSIPDLLGLGIEEASLPGPLRVKVSKKMKEFIIPDYILAMLRDLGRVQGVVGGFASVRLHRV